jgi:hypothetical protein
MFRALIAHPQEALHKRHLVYCVCVMSFVCYQLQTTDINEILFLSVFRKYSRNLEFHYNLTKITSTLHEDHHTFLSYLAQFFLE